MCVEPLLLEIGQILLEIRPRVFLTRRAFVRGLECRVGTLLAPSGGRVGRSGRLAHFKTLKLGDAERIHISM